MHLQRSYYEVLGLPQTATTDEIKKRYRELARKFHPDLVADKALGQRIFTQINQAYRTLSDSERRSQYDATLTAPSARTTANGRPQATVISGTGAVGSAHNGSQRAQADVDRIVRDADVAMISGQAEKAKSLCESALKIEPENAQALSIYGDALAHLKQNDEAIRAYRKSLAHHSSSIVEAKLTRLQAIQEMSPPSSTKTNGTGQSTNRTDPNAGRGLFDRILKRK